MEYLTKQQQINLCCGLKNKAYQITGRHLKVRFTDEKSPVPTNLLGATGEDGVIWLGIGKRFVEDLSIDNKIKFHRGIFAHELMHQILTDFENVREIITAGKLNHGEALVFRTIHNILEDSAIEYYMPDYLDKELVYDFKYAQSIIYEKSDTLEKWGGDYGQYIQAFILYGDGPIIKGNFTSEKAEETFVKTYEMWESGSMEISSAKRTIIALEIYLKSEPIWREYADANQTLYELDKEEGKLKSTPWNIMKNFAIFLYSAFNCADIHIDRSFNRKDCTLRIKNNHKKGGITICPEEQETDIRI